MPAISALGRWRQECRELKAFLFFEDAQKHFSIKKNNKKVKYKKRLGVVVSAIKLGPWESEAEDFRDLEANLMYTEFYLGLRSKTLSEK